MNINIKEMTEQQLLDLQSQITEQLSKPKYPPKGTICEVWDVDEYSVVRYSNGNGTFSVSSNNAGSAVWNNYRVVSQGLTFSDEVIKTKDITPEMDKTLCLCWNIDESPCVRVIDAMYNGAYGGNYRYGRAWDNYRLCTTPYELMPKWAKDIIDKLEE